MSEESSKREGRWVWVAPTLILLGFAVFGVVQLWPREGHPNRSERRQERLLARATAVCESHVPAGYSDGGGAAMTAGSVVAAARFFKQPTGPWDRLPVDHFVASCSYRDPKAEATSPETICPNGEGVITYKGMKLFADEDGRTSPDYVFDSTTPAWC